MRRPRRSRPVLARAHASRHPSNRSNAGRYGGRVASRSSGHLGLIHDDDGITRDLARAVVERGGAIENESEAVAGVELVAIVADPHLDRPFEHPYWLVHPDVARPAVERHESSRRKLDLDDLDRRGEAAWRHVASDIARGRIAPLTLIG